MKIRNNKIKGHKYCHYLGDEFRDEQILLNEKFFNVDSKEARKSRACEYCGRKKYAKGLCRACYERHRRHGRVEYAPGRKEAARKREIKAMKAVETPMQKAARITFQIQYPNEIKPAAVTMLQNRLNTLLTDREREIYLLKAEGLSNAEIGRRYGVSRERIRVQLKYINYQLMCGKKLYGGFANKKKRTYYFFGQRISKRANTVLERAGITTKKELAEYVTSGSLIDLECCGQKTADELTRVFKEITKVTR